MKEEGSPHSNDASLSKGSFVSLYRLSDLHTSPPQLRIRGELRVGAKQFECTGAMTSTTGELCFVYTFHTGGYSRDGVSELVKHLQALARLDKQNVLRVFGIQKDDASHQLCVVTECPPAITLQMLVDDGHLTRQPLPVDLLESYYVQLLTVAMQVAQQKALPPDFGTYLFHPQNITLKTRDYLQINVIEAYMQYLVDSLEKFQGDTFAQTPSMASASTLGPLRLHSLASTPLLRSTTTLEKSTTSLTRSTSTVSLDSNVHRAGAAKSTEEALLTVITRLMVMLVVSPQLPAHVPYLLEPERTLPLLRESLSEDFYQLLDPLPHLLGQEEHHPWIATILTDSRLHKVKCWLRATVYPDDYGVTALMRAARDGHLSDVRRYLYQAGAKDNNGWTALMYAAKAGQLDAARLLLKAEAGIRNKRRDLALGLATEAGHVEMVDLLAPQEARLKDLGSRSVFGMAFAGRNLRIMDTLIREGYALRDPISYIFRAISMDDEELALFLHRHFPRQQDSKGVTALMRACERSRVELARKLIDQQGMRDNLGNTALMYAAAANCRELCRALLGFEGGMTNDVKDFALHICYVQKSVECIPVLLDREKDLLEQCNFTPLMKAIALYDIKSVRVILQSFLGQVDAFGYSALMFACIFNRTDAVHDLIEKERGLNLLDGTQPITLALRWGNMEIAEALLPPEQRREYAQRYVHDKDALFDAIRARDIVLAYILAPTHVKYLDSKGKTALMVAIWKSQFAIAKILAEYAAGRVDNLKKTALMYCTDEASLQIIDSLGPVEKNLMDLNGKTAIVHAYEKGQTEAVRKLAEYEARTKYGAAEQTLLMRAVKDGRQDIVLTLAPYEGKVRDRDGRCAAEHAVLCGNAEGFRTLYTLEQQLLKEDGFTELMLAVAQFSPLTEELIAMGARQRTRSGLTALMVAVYMNNLEAVQELLTSEKGMINNEGYTALMLAAKSGRDKACGLLAPEEAGIRFAASFPCAKKEVGNPTALMLAVIEERNACVRALAPYEASISETEHGMTALMIAACCGNSEAVRLLRDTEAEEQDNCGWTALIHATTSDQTEIVRCLADYEFDIVDEGGRSALEWAVHSGQAECVSILAPSSARIYGAQALNGIPRWLDAPTVKEMRHAIEMYIY
ncbi:Ankyrin repeat protein 1 [Giardia muris]|uniref:Ankyrin repeat protein 1 n=1 Tax=Giardia muris TaxID=5742 RepID=A0A4Z1T3T1_GIAMU|nr:Ankyrin repeat protein 1 [Giardia muris]|eukprot:TNJ27051.1 Ankyrin repeat protein 1 [Giardia muris]